MMLLRNKETRSVVFQILAISAVFATLAYFGWQLNQNLVSQGKDLSFSFLSTPAGYDINQSLIDYSSRDTHLRAAMVGLINTGVVAAFGVILASILGFLVGIMRLSKNFLVNRFAASYVEFFRNVPILLHILLVHGIVVNSLPQVREAWQVGLGTYITNRGLFLPQPIFEPGYHLILWALVLAVGLIWWFRRYAKRVQELTGKIYPVFTISLALLIVLPLLAYLLAGMPITFDLPVRGTFNLQGGMTVKPEFLALWLALSLYTAAFIAEIVRGGILAISHGQTEASSALGLHRNRTLWLIVIPQALRVIIPPLTSQYLNLTKNSSLAIAVGYMDLVATLGGITLNQTGRAIECMIIVLSIYLLISLCISLFMNWYNARVRLVER